MTVHSGKVTCDYCGLPFRATRRQPDERVYCCAGCAVADRVRTKSGEFPVTPELVLALLAGFAAFNQALWAALSWLMALDDQVDLADRFLVISLVVGGVTWLLATVAQVRAGAVTISDKLIIGATLALVGIGVAMGSSVCALIGTIGMLAWGARGWFRPRRAPDASSLQNE